MIILCGYCWRHLVGGLVTLSLWTTYVCREIFICSQDEGYDIGQNAVRDLQIYKSDVKIYRDLLIYKSDVKIYRDLLIYSDVPWFTELVDLLIYTRFTDFHWFIFYFWIYWKSFGFIIINPKDKWCLLTSIIYRKKCDGLIYVNQKRSTDISVWFIRFTWVYTEVLCFPIDLPIYDLITTRFTDMIDNRFSDLL